MAGSTAVSRRELDAAGITDPALRASYERCRRLNAAHGRTYYLATLLLPVAKRPYVHALYGFARHADEFVDADRPDPQGLLDWSRSFRRDWDAGRSDDPVAAACIDTARRWGIPREHFEAFLASMRMDITVTEYATYADLERYMYGSAAVIGLEMVPILEPLDPAAYDHAARLGEAFQLTNFLRDVGEDYRRGRVYLPVEDLTAHGVSRTELGLGIITKRIRELMQFEIARTRRLYTEAEPGIALLHPTSRDCVRTAYDLYGGILDAIEAADYDVLTQRVSVRLPRRVRVAAPRLAHAVRARRVERSWQGIEGPPPPSARDNIA
jgi:15-cis-phytoene synthase